MRNTILKEVNMLSRVSEVSKTRKEHKCYVCNKVIPVGSRCYYHMVVGCSEVANGKLQDGYTCMNCVEKNRG
jgi:hypothetical protein